MTSGPARSKPIAACSDTAGLAGNPSSPRASRRPSPAQTTRSDMQLDVVDGDIAALEVDAIGNAANNALWMGSGVAGAVTGQDLRTSADLVRRTTARCLEVAEELGARSFALPAFGTGVGGFPLDACAEIMVETVRAHEPRSLERVVFAVFGQEARRAFERALE